MGGRLDSTNIITPIASIITSISLDHTQYLGNTLSQIAHEKAGIIKPTVPVVIGETNQEIRRILSEEAQLKKAPVYYAGEEDTLTQASMQPDGTWELQSAVYGYLHCELRGPNQKLTAQTVLMTLQVLKQMTMQIRPKSARKAFAHVCSLTGLMGRWQQLHHAPTVICDIGHNVGAWAQNATQLRYEMRRHARSHIVIGFSDDKDIHGILALLPTDATYYFTQAAIARAFPAEKLMQEAHETYQLQGKCFSQVADATQAALLAASEDDFSFIGGSAFVVAEAYPLFIAQKN